MKLDMNLTSLGESSSAADWVEQARRKEVEKKKQLAEKLREEYENQLRMAEGEDETVPIKRSNMSAYGSSDLKGMKVMHDTSAFDHDQGEVILTLADTSVVAKDEYGKVMGVNEGDEDILENVNLAEQDRRINREKQLKRVRAGIYSGYDDDEFAEGVVPGAKRSILAHYDSAKPSGPRLTLGDDGMLNIASSSSAAATAVANAEHKVRDVL